MDGLWRKLGIGKALGKVLGVLRFSTDVERVIFALVSNRAIASASKLAVVDTEVKVQEAVFFACADLLNLQVDLLFFDTISTYFERDQPDEGENAFSRYGQSKDHRPDLPRIAALTPA